MLRDDTAYDRSESWTKVREECGNGKGFAAIFGSEAICEYRSGEL
jgi:hypothetical protein